jgi:3-oxoacyl-[acyl-carrier-protein] synthase-3
MLIDASGLQVIGCGASSPNRIVTNEELFPSTAEWVKQRLGISSRGYVSQDQSILDMCLAAVQEAIQTSGISVDQLDAIIVATSTPEYVNPSTASIIHGAIGAAEDCAALDIQGVCAGFIYALGMAGALGACKAGKYFLIVGADQFSQITDFESRDSVFFGDAAGAIIVEFTDKDSLFALELKADGKQWRDFHTTRKGNTFHMNSKAVSESATRRIPEAIIDLCNKKNLTVGQIDHFFTHQPSKAVLDKVEENLGFPSVGIYRNLEKRANTASASIPTVFYDSGMFSKIQDGEIVCFAAIGAGWVWGVALLEWRINSN